MRPQTPHDRPAFRRNSGRPEPQHRPTVRRWGGTLPELPHRSLLCVASRRPQMAGTVRARSGQKGAGELSGRTRTMNRKTRSGTCPRHHHGARRAGASERRSASPTVPGQASTGQAAVDDPDGTLAERSGRDQAVSHRDCPAADRRRMAAHVRPGERRQRPRLPAAGRELEGPEAHGGVQRGVVPRQGRQQASAGHAEARGRYAACPSPTAS